ncbi:DEAD/DEAH box helicase [Pseudoclavibacter helvolus]|uniref:DEAD/DEAH box helicase n=1 Tax=Pseudoclavibacter helvolus TaxID=255205 RepID=UPI003734FD1D
MSPAAEHANAPVSFPRAYTVAVRERVELLRGELQRGTLTLRGTKSAQVFTPGSTLGSDTAWVEYWTDLSELLKPVVYYLNSYALETSGAVTLESDLDRMFRFAAAQDRLVAPGLDRYFRQSTSEVEQGRRILTAIVATIDHLATRAEPLVEGSTVSDGARPLTAREAEASMTLIRRTRWVIVRRLAQVLGIPGAVPAEFAEEKSDAEAVKRVWLGGILDAGMPAENAPGIRVLTEEIGRAISTESGLAATFDDVDPFAVLTNQDIGLPPALADRFTRKTGWLLDYRDRLESAYGYERTGILEPGSSELDRLALRKLFDATDRGSFVVVAPTSSGKSRIGQLAVSAAIARRRSVFQPGRVIVLAPTKALVKQTAADLRELFDTEDTADWTVLEGSRDYPQNDEALRLGNFDVAVCIPEKLSALLRIGLPIDHTPLIVIDEMQHLVDGTRGNKLEMLLIDVFRRAPRIRWIGLSASMSATTVQLIETWFASNGKPVTVHQAEYRPVPLQLMAAGTGRSKTDSPFSTTYGGRTIDPLTAWPAVETMVRERDLSTTAKNYDYLLRIIAGLIVSHTRNDADSPLPSILVFVNSRRLAENLSDAFAVVAMRAGIMPEISAEATPFTGGRFSAFPNQEGGATAEEFLTEFNRLPPGRIRRKLKRSIAAGIAFHTSSLNGHLRETIEEAFRSGYVRVLFATDTLKLGVNLPADIVVNGDFVLNADSTQRLLDKDTVIQRVGRAGRLGLSRTHGTGVIAIGRSLIRNPNIPLTIGAEERVGLGGGPAVPDETVFDAVVDVEKVFDHYLRDPDGGAQYGPPLNDNWLLEAATRIVTESPGYRVSPAEMSERIEDVFARSLAGAYGNALPPDILSRLERRLVLAVSDDAVRLTRTGRAAAYSTLGIDAVEVIESIARVARDGAGPLALLYEICASDAVIAFRYTQQMKVTAWLAEGNRKRIVAHARRLLALRREDSPRYFRMQSAEVVDLVGNGLRADALRVAIEQGDADISTMSDGQLTALWRAVVLIEWWGGCPIAEIEGFVGGDSRLRVDETDVRQLAEGIASVFALVADYLGTAPRDMTFRSLLVFSQELEIGLPSVLTSLVRTNDRSMHRERLLGILPALVETRFRWDDVTELIDWFHASSGGVPQTKNGKGRSEWSALTPEDLRRVAGLLDAQLLLAKESTLRLPGDVAERRVPAGSSVMMGEMLREMTSLHGALDIVGELFDAFEVEYDRVGGGVEFIARFADLDGPVKVLIADERVDQEFIATTLAGLGDAVNAVIVTIAGSSAGVLHHSRFLVDRCAVVEPNLFLEMFARIHKRFSVEDEYGQSWNDEFDTEAAAALLGRMLVNNAPVLTRSDLENRLRHDDLV